jgi:hypothetical protein
MMEAAAALSMLTDYLLAIVATVCALRLKYRLPHRRQLSISWWAGGFAALALAAVAGGTYHGIGAALGPEASAALWKLTVYAVGVFNFAALMGSTVGCVGGQRRSRLISLNVALLLVYAVWMATHDDFRYVVYYSAAAMLGLFLLHLVYGKREASTPWMVAAVVVSAIAAVVQAQGIGLLALGYNDLYHLIQVVGVYLFYRGGTLLRDHGLT